MKMQFMLMGGENFAVLEAGGDLFKGHALIYRFYVERFAGCELKIVRDNLPACIISPDSRARVVDVAATGSLFIEAVGTGAVAGWYEMIGNA